ncbi:MAG: 23S rRNA (adenine(2503)-C(2))-methyltransferase RlmN [Candidatus Omnitrophica bacterium]|nr:23S rRNA (adenine(2503)-C(2))-methyltransferase RlmN [Candidatus Omnitrophota bacterium]
MKKNILDYSFTELEKEIQLLGAPRHRAKQIFLWLYHKNADSFSKMTNLPKTFIKTLKSRFVIERVECAEHLTSCDGTEKFLWKLKDGEYVETVLIKEGARRTVCISTQVGCKFACPFCASGRKRFKRNLTICEIVDQLRLGAELSSSSITNIVFMGMGEPMDNYDNLINAIRVMNSPEGLGFAARRITISTCGIVPAIYRLKEENLQIELSISLHAADDKLRNILVPVNRKYPLKELLSACLAYHQKTKRLITLEYILLSGQNDSARDARKLAKLAKKMKAKVNLINYSPIFASDLAKVSTREKLLFKNILRENKVTVTVRKSKGTDILAACGQLAAKTTR